MSAQHIDALKVMDSAAILQLNCRRSHLITNSLFNDDKIANFALIALQEPPINPHSKKPPEHPGWFLIVTQPQDNLEASRPRSCIYVNSRLNADLQPITCSSRDVSSIVITINDLRLLLINVYNRPKTFDGFEAMDSTLRTLPHSTLLLPTILVTDSNIHSALWNPDSYSTHDSSADTLVEAMTKWSLFLRSPRGVVTFETHSDAPAGTAIDLVWVN